jgi:hypothetical protein
MLLFDGKEMQARQSFRGILLNQLPFVHRV